MQQQKAYEILGAEDKREVPHVKQLMERFFARRTADQIFAMAIIGLNPYRSNRRELDLILQVSWPDGSREFIKNDDLGVSKYCLDNKTAVTLKKGQPIFLNNLIATIEVKSHDAKGIRVQGNDLSVKYEGEFYVQTDKLIEQARTAREFMGEQFGIRQHTAHFIFLPNVPRESLIVNPDLERVLLFANSSYSDLLKKAIGQQGCSGLSTQEFAAFGSRKFSLYNDDWQLRTRIREYFAQLIPSTLEQEKLELLSKRFIKDQEWATHIGKSLLAFTGRAGTGKTLKLIRTAKELADNSLENVLFLTFNRALARDLQRLMQLQKISSGTAITVLTIDQFLFRIAYKVGILSQSEVDEFLATADSKDFTVYDAVRSLLRDALCESEKVQSVRNYYRGYSMVAIDEAQDWLEHERDIILSIFQPEQVLIAAGTDQCLRAPMLANWRGDVTSRDRQLKVVPSNTALRQTTNLSIFCNDLAAKIGLDWTIKPNADLYGGEVFLFENFTEKIAGLFLAEILTNLREYYPIDFLALISKRRANIDLQALIQTFGKLGFDSWDAVSDAGRAELPELKKIRVVSLESCRGLEGWSTLLFDLDLWTDFALWKEQQRNPNLDFRTLISLPTWFLIPFTRAKKRMFIQLPQKHGDLRQILLQIYRENPGAVQLL